MGDAAKSNQKVEQEPPVKMREFSDKVEINDCPVEQVRLTVPITDDPTLPCLTFRTWVLGVTACILLSFLGTFSAFRQNVLSLSTISVQILAMPLGKMMAAWLPSAPIRVPGTGWSFSPNPGPFNLKEHVLITIFATPGGGSTSLMTMAKAFYHREISPVVAVLMLITTAYLGYGWAGIFRKFLVDSPYMWWPSNLVQISLFRALHDEEKRAKGGVTRLQFFVIVFISSFAYYVVPNYLFPSVSSISIICLIWKKSITMQQIGSGIHGLGIGSFGLDWLTVSGFLGSPLDTPGSAMINIMFGFFLTMYVIVPIAYWTNTYEAKKFPLFSSQLFTANGSLYNVNQVLHRESLTFDQGGYDLVGQIHLSFLFLLSQGMGFATIASTLSYVALFHGRSIWRQTKEAFPQQQSAAGDIHARMMKKYEAVPQWWFHIILICMLGLAIFTCEGFGRQLQLPYWGVLLAAVTAFLFTLPSTLIYATTNQYLGLDHITEVIIGYAYPGKPLSNMAFRSYANGSMGHCIGFLSHFKLGHYMKIPPKTMFAVQLIGTTISSAVSFGTVWWLLETIDNICDIAKLPVGSPWTCPHHQIYYSSTVIWGVVGPKRIFGSLGLYSKMNYFFLVGFLAPVPVWALTKMFPKRKWIQLINVPIILSTAGGMPPVRSVNYNMWFAVGIFFNFVVYRRYKGWWARHNYALSASLDAGIGFMTILAYLTLQVWGIDLYGINWWGAEVDDHCPLAACPTLPGIKAANCPVIQ